MKKSKNAKTFSKLDFVDEDGRHDIYNWSERRQRKYQGFRKSLHKLQIYAFNTHLLRSFVENFNFMVILQMSLAAFVTYLCKDFNISYDVHVSLFISPIVFPLAFSINTDFQRKEKVLEDLANFKSSAMLWFFCMRDWREACSMDLEYMKAVRNKIKGIVFHLREYLLTEKIDRRKFIVRVIYEDLSDANQLNEKVRCSSMPANSPLVSRIIHFVNMMCLSFERLRVIREYRSPRSIRSFTKVLIFILPLLLSPYYVYLGSNPKTNGHFNSWSPIYISVMVAFVFGALQGVQDKLDDPFDGMSEDDINLDTLDEWTLQSLEATCHRAYKIGRFQVVSSNMDGKNSVQPQQPCKVDPLMTEERRGTKEDISEDLELGFHKYAGVLNNIQGNMTILRGGRVKKREKSFDDLGNLDRKSILMSQALFTEQQNNLQAMFNEPHHYGNNDDVFTDDVPDNIRLNPSLNRLPSVDIVDTESACLTPTSLDFTGNEAPTYGVASYLASVRRNNIPLRAQLERQSSRNSSVASNLSKRSSRSSVVDNDNEKSKAEFFIGDELINRLSPIYQDMPPTSRFSLSNSCTNINPLVFNMHQNSDESSTTDEDDVDDDDDDENFPLELTSLFNNINSRNSPNSDNTAQGVGDNSQQDGYSPTQDGLQNMFSPIADGFNRTTFSDSLHHRNSPFLENLKPRNSPIVDIIQQRNNSGGDYLPRSNSAVNENFLRSNWTGGETFRRSNSAGGENFHRSNSSGGENFPRSSSAGGENFHRSNSAAAENFYRSNSAVAENFQRMHTPVDENHLRSNTNYNEYSQRNNHVFIDNFQRNNSIYNDNLQRSNSVFNDNFQRNNSVFNDNFQRSNSPVFVKMMRGNSLSVNNLHERTRNHTSSPSPISQEHSPLLKASPGTPQKPKSRFTVSKSTSNVNNLTNGDVAIDVINPIVTGKSNDVIRSPQQSPNGIHRNLPPDESINPLMLNMYHYVQPPDHDPSSPDRKQPSPDHKPPSPEQKPPSPDHKPPSPDHKAPSPDFNPPSPDQKSSSPEHKPPSLNYKPSSPEHKLPSLNHKPPSPDHKPPSPSHKPPSPDHKPPSSSHKPPSTDHKPPSPSHKPPSTDRKPPSPRHKPPSPDRENFSPDHNLPSMNYKNVPPERKYLTSGHKPPSPDFNLPSPDHKHLSPDQEEEDLPIELCTTPLFGSTHRMSSPLIEPITKSTSTERLHKVVDDVTMCDDVTKDDVREPPLYDPRDLNSSSIPLFDTLSPKSKHRFVINSVGRTNSVLG